MTRVAFALATLLAVVPTASAAAQDPDSASILLLDRTPWVGDGLDFALTVQLDGVPTDGAVQVVVHDRVRSRTEFTRSTAGEDLRRAVYRPPAAELATADPDDDGVLTVAVPLVARPGIEPAPIRTAGVYPVTVEVTDGDGDVLTDLHTHLVRLPAADPEADAVPILTALVLPITARPAHLGVDAPAKPDVPLDAIASVLADHADVPLTLVPTPETLAAAVADPDPVAVLRGALAGRQVLTGPWVAVDEAAWDRDGPEELERQRALGRATLTELLGADPDGTRLAPAGATEGQLRAMAGGGATAFVLREADLEPPERELQFALTRPIALADVAAAGTLPALVSDPFLELAASRAATDPVLAAHLVLADLAVLASDQPTQRRVATLVLPTDAAGSPEFLEALLSGLEAPAAPPAPEPSLDPAVPTAEAIPAAAAVVRGTTVAEALTEIEPAGVRGEPDPDDPLVRRLATATAAPSATAAARAVGQGRADVGTYQGVFGPDDPLVPGLERAVATAAAAAFDRATRDASLDAVRAAVEEQVRGLVAPGGQTVTLTAREGRVQLSITNDTGRPADVVLRLRGDRLVLPDAPDGLLPVSLDEQSTRVEVRVEARSSGDAPLDVVLLTPDERIELGRARVTVRTTAVSGVGVALLVTSAAFLVLWWTRTILRERRGAKRRHPAHARGSHGPGAQT